MSQTAADAIGIAVGIVIASVFSRDIIWVLKYFTLVCYYILHPRKLRKLTRASRVFKPSV